MPQSRIPVSHPPQVQHDVGPVIALDKVKLQLASDAGPVTILRGIDLRINPGESVGLVGPSGSGKSSLLSVIAGLERPTSGTVEVVGRRLNDLSEDGLALHRRAGVGIVFQSFHLIPTMTALENVAVPLELAGRRDAFTQAEAALRRVGLGQRVRHYPAQLSGGEQQRVALARAVAPGPRLLLADEPTGNLDGTTGEAIIELLFSLQGERGATLLLVTHDMALAARCDRVIRLRDGQVESDSPTQALRAAHA
ncbi:ABC transporter ATP-binding protein [Zavarzinia sp. CC-PAN008]|uniref:ABC transporter ATP-binding protein n=1 Tax=Zavarzinia sp. CC-PAN008 TaxID=3243332 RepID=UPI003F74255D